MVTGHTFDLELRIQTNITGSQGAQPNKNEIFLRSVYLWGEPSAAILDSVGRPIIQSDRFNDWAGYLNPAGIFNSRGGATFSPSKSSTSIQRFSCCVFFSSFNLRRMRKKKPAPSGLTASRTEMMDIPHSQLTD